MLQAGAGTLCLKMPTSTSEYKIAGLQRLSTYRKHFDPTGKIDEKAVNEFVNLFCEYQLADNNYMNIHQQAIDHPDHEDWFSNLSLQEVLRYITYIIWTDRFIENFLLKKISDATMQRLLNRLYELAHV